jgi:hypothetical protein
VVPGPAVVLLREEVIVATKLTPAQIKVLELARDDVVLLVARYGTVGSIDSRKVHRPTVVRMANVGYLKRNISHGSDNDNGYEITPTGLAALGASYKTAKKE